MYLRVLMILVSAALLLSSAPASADQPALLKPDLEIHPNTIIQPFGGEVRFVGAPGHAKPCSVSVILASYKRLDSSERFRLETAAGYGFAAAPDSFIWNAPIDSGASIKMIFVFQPTEVGTYQFTLSRRLKTKWLPLTSLILAIDENSRTACAGAIGDCRLTAVPPHPQRDANPLRVRFPLREARFDPLLDRHFTGDFVFSPAPAVNETTYVDFLLECHLPYSKVQFVLDHSTNIKVSELPKSWGDDVRLDDSSRYCSGRFWIAPVRAGVGALNFRVVGKRASTDQIDRATTEFSIYFVVGEDNKLLFLGSFEPWTRFKSKNDPMLGGLTSLLEVQNREYRLKQILSQPDYQGDENPLPADSASLRKK